jgi:hypothetical protein
VTKQTQADTEIHEDQLRNFLVNTLTGAFGISIAGNAGIQRQPRQNSSVLISLCGIVR